MPTQPGHLFVVRRNEYQPKAMTLYVCKCRYGSSVDCGWKLNLCDPIVIQEPYLSALEIKGSYIGLKRHINPPVYLLLFFYFAVYYSASRCNEYLSTGICDTLAHGRSAYGHMVSGWGLKTEICAALWTRTAREGVFLFNCVMSNLSKPTSHSC